MKFDSSDIMALLRLFNQANHDNTPRQIERIEKTKPHDKNVLIRFTFGKKKFAALLDTAADDDEEYIYEQALEPGVGHSYKLLTNPLADDTTSYSMLFKGKVCYLLLDEPQERRLDIVMTERFADESRSTYQKYIANGNVTVNGTVQTSAKFGIKETDTIELALDDQSYTAPEFETIYEDEHVLVINKPSGMLTHAKGAVVEEFTAADIIKPNTEYNSTTNRPGIVHRLDRDTSGILLMVKTDEAARKIQQQFSNRTVKKEYIAVVSGAPKEPKALLDLPIERNPTAPSTFRVGVNGKPAQTTYHVIQSDDRHSLMRLLPRTGRTHQLRVHMQYIGVPIVGDVVYGGESAKRMLLHAQSLELTLPGGVRKVFSTPAPAEFEELVS